MAGYRQKKSNGRKLIIYTALVIVAGVIIKMYAFPLLVKNDPGAEPDVVTPVHIEETAAAQPPRTEPQPPSAVNPPPIASSPAPVATNPAEINPSPAPAGSADEFYQAGKEALARQDYIAAREKLSRAVTAGLSPEKEADARTQLNQAADQWLFAARKIYNGDEFCKPYLVQPREILVQIARLNNVTDGLLKRINNIKDATKMPAGQNIKLVHGPFQVKVEKKRYLMTVTLGNIIVRSYRVTLGAPGSETPTGLSLVKVKTIKPKWPDPVTHKIYEPEDPENPLGGFWIGLEGLEGAAVGRSGIGIHGTIKPQEIGQSTSNGCIRLVNENAAELFDLLVEGQSRVTVVD